MTSVLAVLKIVLAFASTEAAQRVIRQTVAWVINWALKKYLIDRDKGRDLDQWADLAAKVSEASACLSAAIADGVMTDAESAEVHAKFAPVIAAALDAWADAKPTPDAYREIAR